MRSTYVIYLALALFMLAIFGLAGLLAGPLGLYGPGSTWRMLVVPGPLSQAHAFLEKECGACHTPNKGITATACLTCHATDMPLLAKQSTVFHAEIQECRSCHIEHQGNAVRPVTMDHAVLARIGWRSRQGEKATDGKAMSEIAHAFAGLTGGHPASDVTTLDCHSCHSFRDPHRGLFGRECAECHQTSSWKTAGFVHPSPRSKDCAQCHQAPPSHYMMHFNMISMMAAGQMHAKVEQCYMCHQSDSWNDIKGLGWYKHH